jgi:hypothetical protein
MCRVTHLSIEVILGCGIEEGGGRSDVGLRREGEGVMWDRGGRGMIRLLLLTLYWPIWTMWD